MTAQNQRDPDGTDILGQVRDGLAELKANVIARWGRVPHVAADPTTLTDGMVWTRSDDFGMRYRASSATKVLPLGYVTSATITGNVAGIVTGGIVTGLTVTFTATAGRRYRITTSVYGVNQVGAGAIDINIYRSGVSRQSQLVSRAAGDTPSGFSLVALDTPGAGSITYSVNLQMTATSATVYAAAGAPGLLLVEDIGT